jgi:hypothetical protein
MPLLTVSPTRTYVAVCFFKKYYFKKFHLPEPYDNNSSMAGWYFLNKLDFFSCIDNCYTFEDYSDIRECPMT